MACCGRHSDARASPIFNLKVGDCKLTDGGAEVQATDVVPCDEPHDEEVYFEFGLEGDEFPDAETIETAVFETCIPEFEQYVGIAWQDSALDIRWLEPSAETWEHLDDRIVQCIIVDGAGGKLDASMKGAEI
ncbi:septum formation family protein [Microbacterium sp. Mu-80]|uniref:Septum formation family protein n=1 Tax=Microbacterium bandirmense TaxID=3122050 RepID=A0ABU8L8H8_9MICO